MKKRILSIILALAMVVTLMPTIAFATGDHPETDHGNWKEISDETALTDLFTSGGNGYLTTTIEIENNPPKTLTIAEGKAVNLCLNGQVLKLNSTNIKVDGVLNLYDCGTTEHKFNVDSTTGLWNYGGLWNTQSDSESETVKKVTGGCITGGKGYLSSEEYLGGGVYVASGGTLVMNGGTIAGCSATKGGGVFTWGNMTMNGSSAIIGCTATVDGGGVCACNCSFTMNDNSNVSNCKAGNGAGGVYTFGNNNTASFTMKDNSSISECKASASQTDSKKRNGGGVSVEGSTFTMTGGTISKNEATTGGAGGVSIYNGTFNMTGGTIDSNKAKSSCGGVEVKSGANFNMTGGTITKNTAGFNGGGVYVTGGGNVTMGGGSITDNHATVCGGGLYYTASGTVTLGGKAQITDNYAGSESSTSTNNVYLNSKFITLGTKTGEEDDNKGNGVDAPTEMYVGVTTATAPKEGIPVKITTNCTASDKNYFFSDDEEYAVHFNESEDGYLELVLGFAIINKVPSTSAGDNKGYITVINSAYESEEVSLTVKPSKGYQLKEGSLKVTYVESETELELIQDEKDASKYTFTMPNTAVTVTAEFELKNDSNILPAIIAGAAVVGGAAIATATAAKMIQNATAEVEPITPATPVIPILSDCDKGINCPLSQFSDLNAAYWYHDGIHFILESGLMKGIGDNQFNPNGKTTRPMMMTILARLDGQNTERGETWDKVGKVWAKNNGVSEGIADAGNITREEFATMLYRYANLNGQGFTGSWMFMLDFKDAAKISAFANEAMHWCVMKGILNGKGDGMLDPQGELTRAEAAAMIQRFIDATK